MDRSFAADDLIALPRTNSAGAIALGTEIETAASGKKLPKPIAKALGVLVDKRKGLEAASRGRLTDAAAGTETAAARAADRVIDACWSACFSWLLGWSKLPLAVTAEAAAIARNLLALLFPEQLKFTQLPYKLEWSESQTRIDIIDEQKLAADFATLGGDVFLKSLRAAHKAYGEALGLTKAIASSLPAASALQTPLLEFNSALRTYALRVAAHRDEDDAASLALADALLAPLVVWRSAAANAPAAPPVAPPAAPAGAPGGTGQDPAAG